MARGGAADEYINRLRSVPLFAECDESELREVASLGTEVSVPAGRQLMVEGDGAHEAFLLEDGHALATRGGKEIARFGPGDFFGEMALIANRPRSATVVAEDEVTVRAFHTSEFRQMMQDVPSIALKILATMAERLLDSEDAPTH
jgi:CRP-like cAMP-binding protein